MSLHTAGCDGDFILLDHHPDLVRRPEPRPGILEAENRRAALTWNVFRTLELIAPAFWLRRFRARLGALTSIDPAGQSLAVRLWTELPAVPVRQRHDPVGVDALVETDTAVYGVITGDASDVGLGDTSAARPDAFLRTIDALSWYAGARDGYVALITPEWSDAPIGTALIERYGSSREALTRRLPHRRDGLANVRGIGRMTWRDVAGIIRDCAESDTLTDLERLAASRTHRWLSALGIRPA